MTLYRFCNYSIESDLPLELVVVEEEKSKITFHSRADSGYEISTGSWFHQYHLSYGNSWLSLAKQGLNYLLRFPDLADFLVLTQEQKICCYTRSDIPMETIQHLFLDQVMPRFLSHLGKVVLHAGAVLLPEGVIAFLGEAGWGKSTLTTYFCQQGYPLLTDDCLLLQEGGDQILAIPSYPGLRLWPETMSALFGGELPVPPVAHYTQKKRLHPERGLFSFCAEPVPLHRLYLLVPPEERVGLSSITIARLSPREALMALVEATYRLDITDRTRAREEFEQLSRLATSVKLYRLAFPQDLSLLPDVQAAIMKNEK